MLMSQVCRLHPHHDKVIVALAGPVRPIVSMTTKELRLFNLILLVDNAMK